MRVMKAMDGKGYFRISWRRLICIVGALLVIGAPISAALCSAGDCLGQSSKTHAGCSGMAMPRSETAVNAQSRVDCCQISQGFPATFRQSTDTEKTRAEFSLVSLEKLLPKVVATRGMMARPVDSLPPQDVQSLFCTLLI